MGKEGSVVVFDKTANSMEALIHVVERQPRFMRAVSSWLSAENAPYLLLGSTGGARPEFFAIGARDIHHLLRSVLTKAAETLDATLFSDSSASAIDEELSYQVNEAWSEIVAKRSPQWQREQSAKFDVTFASQPTAPRTLIDRTGSLSTST